jgi:hypothetical protein
MAEFICAFTCFGSLPIPTNHQFSICSQGKLLSTIALLRVLLTAYKGNDECRMQNAESGNSPKIPDLWVKIHQNLLPLAGGQAQDFSIGTRTMADSSAFIIHRSSFPLTAYALK